ncbi:MULTISPECIES: cellulose synthase operon protein YhjQ/BcsQ [Novosphingobium]|uniref:ATPase n=1 Tax=Novosphingobium decolorationis TaxID=2698673 RepID=A0ABX8E2U9_9SPHN|nr:MULTISPECIES: cellulose synthase operon protein YhjQ/BcsQ [Novosphingobium]MED5544122.1 cellulose synthase operon protein YhjQ/BcsQ [Pseudomonadota bacterium]QVM83457.1 ATPase [Novosphingobium decolorationis]GAM05670.1 ATPase [Novosphingobium sp. MBES04]
MALIVCHSPKGGTGNTFLAAHMALGLAEAGADVTVLSMAAHDTLPFHFALPPSTTLSALHAPSEDAVVVSGIDLRHAQNAPNDPDFIPMLKDLGYFQTGRERTLILDVPSCERNLARRLVNHACAHLCALDTAPETLALLPQMFDEAGKGGLSRTSFVINRLDDTRRLARHNAAFVRELMGPRLIGRIRLDESVPESIAMLQTLARYAPSSAALADVRRLVDIVLPALDTDISIWSGAKSSSYAA